MTASTPRQRYEQESETTRGTLSGKLIVVVVIVILLGIGYAGIKLYNSQKNNTISGKTATVEQVNDSTMRLWFDVTRKSTDNPSYCIVTAVDYDRGEVGRREVVIPAGGEKVQRIEVDITTTSAAASADVYGCSEDLPFYLKVPS
ncbi:DUF4307 domain-containing protein [Corynebacterium sp. SCR221107]|uniref:DUF4307 domain-containing protein n=1 Tax=Corynebacterium sp. SCR221107 TaxID=3017361 RepID=UPI0022EC4F58|nr:DUF4307 domain-containing protein [Corynebacterium sp. SCR221107]WBT09645.1 DUF4307 domain-containing protein [Corynebacterium sp. SCR221107]